MEKVDFNKFSCCHVELDEFELDAIASSIEAALEQHEVDLSNQIDAFKGFYVVNIQRISSTTRNRKHNFLITLELK